MEKFTKGPHFAVEYAGYYVMQATPYYDDRDDLLNVETCPFAEFNAKLYSHSPEMYDLLKGITEGNTLDPEIVQLLLNKINS